jgi:hypothetical protein
VRIASDNAPNADGGAACPSGENHGAHQRSAIRFHRDKAAARAVRAAKARSFARTCSSVSLGIVSSENRTGRASRNATRTVPSSNSGSRCSAGARRPGDRWMPEVGEPRAEQAVADLEPMIEEAQRPVGSQRREPQR